MVIVARGGGSLEDLSAYNTEVVARATYACQKPIISAVGHETDFTIIDFVSDMRAPTPSAAAELISRDTSGLTVSLKRDVVRLSRLLENFIADKNLQFQGTKNILMDLMETYVTDRKQHLQKLTQNISSKLNTFLIEKDYDLKLKISALSKHNPLDILRLGYAKIEQQGKTIGKLKNLNLSLPIEINFVDGQIDIVADKKKP